MNYVGDTTKEPTLEHIYQTEMVQIKYDATYVYFDHRGYWWKMLLSHGKSGHKIPKSFNYILPRYGLICKPQTFGYFKNSVEV